MERDGRRIWVVDFEAHDEIAACMDLDDVAADGGVRWVDCAWVVDCVVG
jgi:hypothetical protein